MSTCLACKGLGCQVCRSYHIDRITFVPSDQEWKASEPSLSAAIAAVIERTQAEPDFRSQETQ